MAGSGHGASTTRNGDGLPLGTAGAGKFGRLFPTLRAFRPADAKLDALAAAMVDSGVNTGDNPAIPAGYTYLGQFIDHDITFDPTSLGEVNEDPLATTNFRTPRLDLDSVYGRGPAAQPYLYDDTDPALLAIGVTNAKAGAGDPKIPPALPRDLPRSATGIGLLGDPRNDENLIVAQTHLAFLHFHNAVVAGLRGKTIPRTSPSLSDFEQARELVVWHYQWVVLHDFLPRIADPAVIQQVKTSQHRMYRPGLVPFLPVEFSAAAYRLGHSMVREAYDYNRVFKNGGITPATLALLFRFTHVSGNGIPIPSDWIINWHRFFATSTTISPNLSRLIDPFLAPTLANVPRGGTTFSLPSANLRRGARFGLPTGQAVAKALRLVPLTPAQIASGADGLVAKAQGFDVETPLWYYILKEAQVTAGGKHLGAVGSWIVAEVFLGLLEHDPGSFLTRQPNFAPSLPSKVPGTFEMADLLQVVAAGIPPAVVGGDVLNAVGGS